MKTIIAAALLAASAHAHACEPANIGGPGGKIAQANIGENMVLAWRCPGGAHWVAVRAIDRAPLATDRAKLKAQLADWGAKHAHDGQGMADLKPAAERLIKGLQ